MLNLFIFPIGIPLNTNDIRIPNLMYETSEYNLQNYHIIDTNDIVYINKGLAIDSEENIYQTGNIYSSGNHDAILIKMSNQGELIWDLTWGGINNDYAIDLAIDSQDYVYVVSTIGCKYSDRSYWMEDDQYDKIFLVKYDSAGNEVWNKTWDNLLWARGRAISIDSADNIIIAGSAKNNGFDAVLLKYNSSGFLLWEKTFGWEGDEALWGPDIAVDSENNIFLGCNTREWSLITQNSSDSYDWNVVMTKFNTSGNQIWNKTWNNIKQQKCRSVAVDSNGDLYVSGVISSDIPHEMTFILKYNSSGTRLWKTFWKENNVVCEDFIEGTFCEFHSCTDMLVGLNDTIYLAGSHGICEYYGCSFHNVLLLSFDKNGTFLSEDSQGFGEYTHSEGIGITLNSNNDILVSGMYFGFDVGPYIILLNYSKSPKPPFPGHFSLFSNAKYPDKDGIFTLFWTNSSGADNYSLFMDTKPLSYPILPDPIITTTELSFTLNLTISDRYYFLVVASNESGKTPSQIIRINVQISVLENNPPFNIPGYDIIIILSVASTVFFIVLIKRRKIQKKDLG